MASDFVNCSRAQSLVAHPDTSSTAPGIIAPISIICRIRPASFVNVGQSISTNANLPGRATSKPDPVPHDRSVGVATLGRYGLYLGDASRGPIEARSGRPAAPAL